MRLRNVGCGQLSLANATLVQNEIIYCSTFNCGCWRRLEIEGIDGWTSARISRASSQFHHHYPLNGVSHATIIASTLSSPPHSPLSSNTVSHGGLLRPFLRVLRHITCLPTKLSNLNLPISQPRKHHSKNLPHPLDVACPGFFGYHAHHAGTCACYDTAA